MRSLNTYAELSIHLYKIRDGIEMSLHSYIHSTFYEFRATDFEEPNNESR